MSSLIRFTDTNLLVSSALSFICGIIFAPHLRFIAISETQVGLMLAILLTGLTVLQVLAKNRLLLLLLPLFFSMLGCFYTLLHLQVPTDDRHIYHQILGKNDLVVIGTMTAMAKYDGRTSQVPLALEALQERNSDRLTPATGTILIRLQGPWPKVFQPGDRLAVRGDFKRPTSYRTPGSFDYAQYLARRDIWVTGFVRSPSLLQSMTPIPSFLENIKYLPERLRSRLGDHIDGALKPESSGIYRAILIGDRSRVNDTTLESFKGSGTMHILAISGIHVAVIGSLIYNCIYYILSRSEKLLLHCTIKKWAAFFSLPMLIGYGLLAGLNTPVTRAVVMSSVVIVAMCTNRRKSPGPLVASAAILLLIMDPLQVFTASFQLSFSAVIAILFLLPVLQKLCWGNQTAAAPRQMKDKLTHWFLAAILVSFAATAATAPIAIYVFNRFSPIGLVANIFVEPLICLWTLPAGFLAIPFIFAFPEIATLLLQVGNLGLQSALQVTSFCSSFSFSTVWLASPPFGLLISYYTLLLLFAVWGYKATRRAAIVVSLLLLCAIPFVKPSALSLFRRQSPDFLVSYLDVGQGSATLLEFPSGMRILLDGGGRSFGAADVGKRVIAPFLWHKGIDHLDAIVITHPDADHYNGLGFILEHFTPDILWVRDRLGHDDNFRNLLVLAAEKHIPVITPSAGQRLGSDLEFISCIANTLKDPPSTGGTRPALRSNSGLILKTCSDNFCTLFPGDIEKDEEIMLVAEHDDLGAEILLAPHHGSATSSTPGFLAAVSPKFLIVSAGRSSAGHFPHRKVRDECARQGVTLLSTAEQGTMEIAASGKRFRINGFARATDNPLYPMEPLLIHEPPKKPGAQQDRTHTLSPGSNTNQNQTSVKSDGAFLR